MQQAATIASISYTYFAAELEELEERAAKAARQILQSRDTASSSFFHQMASNYEHDAIIVFFLQNLTIYVYTSNMYPVPSPSIRTAVHTKPGSINFLRVLPATTTLLPFHGLLPDHHSVIVIGRDRLDIP
jgi:hypothetical protein